MRYVCILVALLVLIASCKTTNDFSSSVQHALIGQDEAVVMQRMRAVPKTASGPDGGKILIYEFHSRGDYLTPYRSNVIYDPTYNMNGEREGFVLRLGVHTAANDPRFTIYQTNVSYLKIYLDKDGICTHIEQNLPQEQLEIYHERLKHFKPENR